MSFPIRAASALAVLALSSSSALASNADFTSTCSASNGPLSVWTGDTEIGNQAERLRVESVALGQAVKRAVAFTQPTDACSLNPATSGAGLTADELADVVVLHLHEAGEPIGVIAVFDDGTVHVNMQVSTAAAAHALLENNDRIEAASAIYEQLADGPLKAALLDVL